MAGPTLERLEAQLADAKAAHAEAPDDPDLAQRKRVHAQKVREARWTARGGPKLEQEQAEAAARLRAACDQLAAKLCAGELTDEEKALVRQALGVEG